jgi:Plasmid pRiA4b ORF-3-like protein
VGGSHAYAEFLQALKDPTHEEHTDVPRWVGGSFDPTRFDLDLVNQLLATVKA